jgi:hypothetical protein
MVHNKTKRSWSAWIVPKGIAFIHWYLAHIEYLCHNFKCVAALTIAAFADYACSKDDLFIIEHIKEIPSSPGQEVVVEIDGIPINRYHTEYLFQPDSHVYDEVITSQQIVLFS